MAMLADLRKILGTEELETEARPVEITAAAFKTYVADYKARVFGNLKHKLEETYKPDVILLASDDNLSKTWLHESFASVPIVRSFNRRSKADGAILAYSAKLGELHSNESVKYAPNFTVVDQLCSPEKIPPRQMS